ncbi:hypothetical protein BJ944DRAFT_158403 [Cunninghamella echinulata]|nr:hypothetical protein BJ944DRAFT_158403 [Cunninghamella echinulata]
MSLIKTKEEKRRFAYRQLLSFGTMVVVDIALPLVLFYVLKMYISLLAALLISGIPPLLHVIVKFIYRKKVDALGCIIVFSFVLSAILSVISGDARLALLRDSTVTAVIAAAFLITLIPITTKWFTLRPLTYLIGLQFLSELPPLTWVDKNGEKQEQHILEFLWDKSRDFRMQSRIQTTSWGVTLLGEFIATLIMIESSLSVDNIVWISKVIVIVMIIYNVILATVLHYVYQKRLSRCVAEWLKENDYSEAYKTSTEEDVQEEEMGEQANHSDDSTKKLLTNNSGDNLV